ATAQLRPFQCSLGADGMRECFPQHLMLLQAAVVAVGKRVGKCLHWVLSDLLSSKRLQSVRIYIYIECTFYIYMNKTILLSYLILFLKTSSIKRRTFYR